MPQESIYWQGTQRRSCAPGAHWNVQVVRGKVTTRCLWHACKAFGIGLLLILLGACMATIGYYADELSTGQEIRENVTVKVTNKSKGFRLNNLSYAAPVVMGLGGFIVVAACVMTFEARDSAAKVVPARFRFSQGSTLKYARNQRPRRSTSSQTSKWDHQLGLFRINKTPSPNAYEISRKQLTAEFLRFSKNLNEKNNPQINTIKKSPSAPSLVTKKSPLKKKQSTKYSGCSLLNPELLKRHALSVDNPGYSPTKTRDNNNDINNKINGSQMSMAMDLYLPNKGPVTLKIKDRSDTARRHQLLRQTKIEDMEEEEAKRQASIRRHAESVAYMMGAYARYPTDFVSRKRASIDLRLTDEFGAIGVLSKGNSPRDLRKTSLNFRQMSVDRSSSLRKSSIDFRKSPDFRRSDCKNMMDGVEIRSRSNTGESNRKARHKLHHSKSDESRRKSLDRHNRRDSHQESRHSLNTPVVIETCGPEYELKYFTPKPNSIDKDNASNTTDAIEIEETEIHITTASIEDYPNDHALVEEPELETTNDNEIDKKLSHKIIDDEKNKNKYIDEYNSNEPTINVDD